MLEMTIDVRSRHQDTEVLRKRDGAIPEESRENEPATFGFQVQRVYEVLRNQIDGVRPAEVVVARYLRERAQPARVERAQPHVEDAVENSWHETG